MSTLAPVLEGFFTERLAQRRASPHTIASYRDTWRLLLGYARKVTGTEPSKLEVADLDATLIAGFLDHLEHERGNGISTRNQRLIAIHSLFVYAALRCPDDAAVVQRVLSIPRKRPDTAVVTFLDQSEAKALLASPDTSTFYGRRDHLLILVALQTGLRVSELTALTPADVTFGTGANVHCTGKGRKQRFTPLTADTAKALRAWIVERGIEPGEPLFATRKGGRLSTDAVEDLLAKHTLTATASCVTLANKNVTPHTLRHSCVISPPVLV